jgi:hypothetical protein
MGRLMLVSHSVRLLADATKSLATTGGQSPGKFGRENSIGVRNFWNTLMTFLSTRWTNVHVRSLHRRLPARILVAL